MFTLPSWNRLSQRTSLLSSKVFSSFLSFSCVQTTMDSDLLLYVDSVLAMSGWIMMSSICHDVGSVLFSSRDICCCANPYTVFLTSASHHSLIFACALISFLSVSSNVQSVSSGYKNKDLT